METNGKYLYCIIRCGEERAFDDAAPIGGAAGAVYTIPHDGLALVVSDSPATEYETTRAHMMAHERVLERVMREYTLLPVRFGTVADSTYTVQDMCRLLVRRSQEFHGLLRNIEGKAELGLKALWRDEKAVFGEVVAENAAIRRLRDSLLGKPPEVARYQAIPLGEMVKEALDLKRKKEAAGLLGRLRPLAHMTRENTLAGDRMVLNAAFLVARDREAEFDREVAQIESELGHRLILKYVGPVPPYNFVNIVVNWLDL